MTSASKAVFPARSPRPFTVAWAHDGPGLERGHRGREREPEVVVAVDRERGERGERRHDLPRPLGRQEADRVAEAEPVRAALDPFAEEVGHEGLVGPARVLARELDHEPPLLRVLDRGKGHAADGRAVLAELLLDVEVRDGHDQVNRVRARVRGPVDVDGERANVAADLGAQIGLGHEPDPLALALGGGRGAGLDHVDTHLCEHTGDLEFLVGGEGHAGRLFAVAERRIEESQPIGE